MLYAVIIGAAAGIAVAVIALYVVSEYFDANLVNF